MSEQKDNPRYAVRIGERGKDPFGGKPSGEIYIHRIELDGFNSRIFHHYGNAHHPQYGADYLKAAEDTARRLNAHEDLLAACQQLVRVAGLVSQFQIGDGRRALDAGVAAIAQAKPPAQETPQSEPETP